jgi:hypothetical protein
MSESITEDFATIRLRVAEIEAERAKWLAAAPIEEVQFDRQSDAIDVTSEWDRYAPMHG